jgi:hypothetical protein
VCIAQAMVTPFIPFVRRPSVAHQRAGELRQNAYSSIAALPRRGR